MSEGGSSRGGDASKQRQSSLPIGVRRNLASLRSRSDLGASGRHGTVSVETLTPLPSWATKTRTLTKKQKAQRKAAAAAKKEAATSAHRLSAGNLPTHWRSVGGAGDNAIKERVHEMASTARRTDVRALSSSPTRDSGGAGGGSVGAKDDGTVIVDEEASATVFSASKAAALIDDAELTRQDKANYVRIDKSEWPLEQFDSADFDKFTPEQWFARDQSAFALYRTVETGWTWREVEVLGYEASVARFDVQFVGMTLRKYVRRINLRFSTEDEANFEARRAFCEEQRSLAIANVALDHFVDQRPAVARMPIAMVQSLFDSLGALAQSSRQQMRAVLSEVSEQYQHSLKKAAIFHLVPRDEAMRAAYEEMRLPALPAPEVIADVATFAIGDLAPGCTFKRTRVEVNERLLITNPDLMKTIELLYSSWRETLSGCFVADFDALRETEDIALPCSMEAYGTFQAAHCELIATSLREWRERVINQLIDVLQFTEDLFEPSLKRFRKTRLFKILTAFEMRIAAQLRFITALSLERTQSFLALWLGPDAEAAAVERCATIDRRRAGAQAEFTRLDNLPGSEKEGLLKPANIKKMLAFLGREFEDRKDFTNVMRSLDPEATNAIAFDHFYSWLMTYERRSDALEGIAAGVADVHSATTFVPVVRRMLVPVMRVHLVMQASGTVVVKPSLSEMTETFLAQVTSIVKEVRSVKEIKAQVMPLLKETLGEHPILDLCEDFDADDETLSANGIVARENLAITAMRRSITLQIADAYAEAERLCTFYEQYSYVMKISPAKMVKDFAAKKPEPKPEEFRAKIGEYRTLTNNIRDISYNEEDLGFLRCSAEILRAQLLEQGDLLARSLLDELEHQVAVEAKKIEDEYVIMEQKIDHRPADAREADETAKYLAAVLPKEEEKKMLGLMYNLQQRTLRMHSVIDVLSGFEHQLSSDDFHEAWQCWEWPNKITENVLLAIAMLDEDQDRMKSKLNRDRDAFLADLELYRAQVNAFTSAEHTWDEVDVVSEEALEINGFLQDATETMEHINEREVIFGLEMTVFDDLQKMVNDFGSHFSLWTMAADFITKREVWLNGAFIKLDAAAMREDVGTWSQESERLRRSLAKRTPAASKIAKALKAEAQEFKQHVKWACALASKALKPAHWEYVSEACDGIVLIPDEELTMDFMIKQGVGKYWVEIDEITTRAEKEFLLEKKLTEMQGEMLEVEMAIAEHKKAGDWKIIDIDELYTLLDDQIVKVQQFLSSSFVGTIKPRCVAYDNQLNYVVESLDEWMKLQKTWMYLEPIFASDDIKRQMPSEARAFTRIDKTYREVMDGVVEEAHVLQVCVKERRVYERFKAANAKLDEVQKALADYLAVKRLAFPRFYFLADEELLQILSQTKDPRKVQPYLAVIFDGIKRVTFDEEAAKIGGDADLSITTMVASEKVELLNKIYPCRGANIGAVENWAAELRDQMRLTVKDQWIRSMDAYPEAKRVDWAVTWPQMLVLNVSQLFWTREVEHALENNELHELCEALQGQLDDIVMCVRGKLSKLQKKIFMSLCIVDVHARNVVQDDLIGNKVHSRNDFEWLCQLRYYWEHAPDEPYNRYGTNPMNVLCRILNDTKPIMYGYEYLGNQGRLVVTPLTDRCYRTMMGAVALDYGGAPAGPAGTGKTETVKDLSKSVAIKCIVYNCNDGMTFKSMAKIFKGLAASGAWACFDEFNRIRLEVLSVIAQQLLEILNAKRAKRPRFDFEGTNNLPLNPDCNQFITMNPGYAGRSDLPDNLQALFRPCAMMVPDYKMIAEIFLFGFGFIEGASLSRKLTQVLALSSELLSPQKHYDYGMRAVFSILMRCGALRNLHADDWSESVIVLSAISDVNLPKFTANDLPLFRGIVADLFPGVELVPPNYDILHDAITRTAADRAMQDAPSFHNAVVQLYETVGVRHGLMVVGDCYSGKTHVIHTLAQAMTRIQEEIPDQEEFRKTIVHTINPKSINSGQLYGKFDNASGEWTDGVLAVLYRTVSKDPKPIRHWIVFDGPVDAVWIEDMNTVLDDNKKLCLTSGEIMMMSPWMTMMFETEDLKEASPATVSRVGMVFMEPKRLGWQPLMESWFTTLCVVDQPSGVARDPDVVYEFAFVERIEPYRAFIRDTMVWLFSPLRFFALNCVAVPLPMTFMELAANCLRLLKALLAPFFCDGGPLAANADEARGAPVVGKKNKADPEKVIEAQIIIALTWSCGAVTDKAGRSLFTEFFRKLLAGTVEMLPEFILFNAKNPEYRAMNTDVGRKMLGKGPGAEGTVYDYCFKASGMNWGSWTDGQKKFKIPAKAAFDTIVVPTIDTLRHSWIVEMLLKQHSHVLVTGGTGTGKTASIKHILAELSHDAWMPLTLNFSAQTSANMTQDIIDGKMGKVRKGIFGPPASKWAAIFVDDLNMPEKEEYGAQPPIEILRQWMDHMGWYDLLDKDKQGKSLINLQFLAAMGPPGGGKTRISQRMVRHFSVIAYCEYTGDSLGVIFNHISEWMLSKFPSKLRGAAGALVDATIQFYHLIQENMLPTPAKSHYTFNLRDLAKVFQGMNQGSPEVIKETVDVLRLWGHECTRTFHDRLTTKSDRKWFMDTLGELMQSVFNKKWAPDVRGANELLIFGNFANDEGTYGEVADHEAMNNKVNEALEDYNSNERPMPLVMFGYAIEHVARINRIINQAKGHALLVGVGGSGRKSLTKLATYMANMAVFEIEIKRLYRMEEWHDDLKKLMMQVGVKGRPTVFLFNDAQIVIETFVEDISNMLGAGEVPNLFNKEERTEMFDALDKIAKTEHVTLGTPDERMEYFVDRCRKNLHIVLAFSPIGDGLRRRLIKFPSLVNCCTIDWFTPWPEDALLSVAERFLSDMGIDHAIYDGVVAVCGDMQSRVGELAIRFREELGRNYYVTPTSYLELIKTFKALCGAKQKEIEDARDRLQNGLDKLEEADKGVAEIKASLVILKPQLAAAAIETTAALKIIAREQKAASIQAASVAKDEAAANKVAAEAKAIADDCDADLARAQPAMDAAKKALKNIQKKDIDQVKSFKTEPSLKGITNTLEATCLFFGVKGDKVKDAENPGKKRMSFWAQAQKHVLSNPNQMIARMMGFEAEFLSGAVSDKQVAAVRAVTKRRGPDSKGNEVDQFALSYVKNQSEAAYGIAVWVYAMLQYHETYLIVAPKKIALAEATAKKDAAMAIVAEKQAELAIVQAKIDHLNRDLAETQAKEKDLADQAQLCNDRLIRSGELVGGLANQKTAWEEGVVTLGARFTNALGDVLLSSGQVAYLGAFTSTYRESAAEEWRTLLKTKGIPCSDDFSLTRTLGNAVQIRDWGINKLPADSFSIDNAIMMDASDRWPLMIDPQRQASKWVSAQYADAGIVACKMASNTFGRTLEGAVSMGKPLLVECTSADIDPLLTPVLQRSIQVSGGLASIRIGDSTVDYDYNFKLFITTVLRNPHYPPETCVMVNLLNFMATAEGLEDQMLAVVVSQEEPQLQADKEQLVVQDAANKSKLQDLEDEILRLLKESTGQIVDDIELIETLKNSNILAGEIAVDMKRAEVAAIRIDKVRSSFQPAAFHAAGLYFCIADLLSVDPMYCYALDWYIKLYIQSVGKTPAAPGDTEKRVMNLNETFTEVLFLNICRSLFSKHILLFSFMLTTKILIGRAELTAPHLRFFLAGSTALGLEEENPCKEDPKWLDDKSWMNVLALSKCEGFKTFSQFFKDTLPSWKAVIDNDDPAPIVKELIMEDHDDLFSNLMVLRCFRLDKLVPLIQDFISRKLGPQFIESPPLDIDAAFQDADCTMPLVFVLTPGVDPMSDLLALGEKYGVKPPDKFGSVSLGDGQGPRAEALIAEAVDRGMWVCLQNCHLAVSWLPVLQNLVEELSPETTNPNFRLWLTSCPSPSFPISILEKSVKMTVEPPTGIRANIAMCYTGYDEEWFEDCRRPHEFKKMLFSLCFFHALIRARRKFGPLGWNIPYAFSIPDLKISTDQLRLFLDLDTDHIPFKLLQYCTAECNYGGRVTDDKDRRCLQTILTDFYCEDVFDDEYKYSIMDEYYAPKFGNIQSYLDYADTLPINEPPELFGLHPNANITCAISESNLLLKIALSLQPRTGGGGGADDGGLAHIALQVQGRVPDIYDVEKVEVQYPTDYMEAMNTVLTQELVRFNELLVVVKKDLVDIQLALKGELAMSTELEALGVSMENGWVPDRWMGVCYPSLKPLASWVSDLLKRLNMLQMWIDGGSPATYWVSGFFFTQAFLTGTRQNFARKHEVAIDDTGYDFDFFNESEALAITEKNVKAEDGCYCYGLFMDGARYDNGTKTIHESLPKALVGAPSTVLPLALLLPRRSVEIKNAVESHRYECPVYKTSERQGMLSTTGHSTNFVIMLMMPMSPDDTAKKWTKMGLGCLTQTDD